MHPRSFARLAVLLAAASIVAGCAAASGDPVSTAPPLQLRLVASSAPGPCSAPPLTSDGPGTACDTAGTTTYELAGSLGAVTPTSVTRNSQGNGQAVAVKFAKADADTLRDVTSSAIDKRLALLLDGKVLSAATVKAPITAGMFTFSFGTASEADQVATALGAPATS